MCNKQFDYSLLYLYHLSVPAYSLATKIEVVWLYFVDNYSRTHNARRLIQTNNIKTNRFPCFFGTWRIWIISFVQGDDNSHYGAQDTQSSYQSAMLSSAAYYWKVEKVRACTFKVRSWVLLRMIVPYYSEVKK